MTSPSTDRRFGQGASIAQKAPCRLATTGSNITLSGSQTIDGVATATDDRILVKDQTDSTENGIYSADTGDWTRTTDFDGQYDATGGTLVFVNQGSVNSHTGWMVFADGAIVIGTDDVVFTAVVPPGSWNASALVFNQTGTGEVAQTVQSVLRNIVWADGFNLLPGNTAAANTTALQNIATKVNALGAATLFIPPGTYSFNGTTDTTSLCQFSNLTGLAIIAPGVVFADQTTYSGTQTGILFSFSASSHVSVPPGMKITSAIDLTNSRGLRSFQFKTGSYDFDVDFEQSGGLTQLEMLRLYTDPDSYRTALWRAKLKATSVHYVANGQHSGDGGVLQLDTNGCTRDVFFYGASHLDIRWKQKNPFGTSLIAAYNGFGCSDLKIRLHDRESTSHINNPRLGIVWNDATAATHRNIELITDIANVAGSAGTPFLYFSKIDNSGVADTTGRGHHFENFTLSGNSTQIAACNHVGVTDVSKFATTGTPDVIKNLKVKDFVGTGAGVSDDWTTMVGALTDTFTWENVNRDDVIVVTNASNGRVVFKDCKATGFNANQSGGQITYGDTGAAMVLIDTKTASNSATLDFTVGMGADYPQYVVEISGLQPATNASQLQMLGSSDSGANWKTGAGAYIWEYSTHAGGGALTTTGGADTKVALTPASVNNGTGTLRATIEISSANDTTNYKHLNYRVSFYDTTGPSIGRVEGAALYAFATALNAIRFQMSAGNITAATISLYGVRKS